MGQIIAFEGPSGSGKGYQLEQAKALYQDNCFPIVRPTYPRTLDDWLGVWSSSMLDYQAILAACVQNKFVLADRFLLSRWVYIAYLYNDGKLTNGWYHDLKQSFFNLQNTAIIEARLRQTELKPVSIIIHVLLPNDKILDKQRQKSGKHYPFIGKIERRLYFRIAQQLIEDPIPGINIKIQHDIGYFLT